VVLPELWPQPQPPPPPQEREQQQQKKKKKKKKKKGLSPPQAAWFVTLAKDAGTSRKPPGILASLATETKTKESFDFESSVAVRVGRSSFHPHLY
jgi:hypothetical protein